MKVKLHDPGCWRLQCPTPSFFSFFSLPDSPQKQLKKAVHIAGLLLSTENKDNLVKMPRLLRQEAMMERSYPQRLMR